MAQWRKETGFLVEKTTEERPFPPAIHLSRWQCGEIGLTS